MKNSTPPPTAPSSRYSRSCPCARRSMKRKTAKPAAMQYQDVQRRRQAGQPQAEGPQQVIQQRRSHAQQDRLTEEQERLGESRGHGASPEQPVEKAPRS